MSLAFIRSNAINSKFYDFIMWGNVLWEIGLLKSFQRIRAHFLVSEKEKKIIIIIIRMSVPIVSISKALLGLLVRSWAILIMKKERSPSIIGHFYLKKIAL